MESQDPEFLKQPNIGSDDQEEDSEEGGVVAHKEQEETDISILNKLLENLNVDFENFLSGNIKKSNLEMPNGEILQMTDICEQYLFETATKFIRSTLKRKTYDVGSVELKFYVTAKNVA